MSLLLLFQPQTAVVPLVQGDIFHDGCSTSANYDILGANTTVGGNNGMFGTLGASGSIRVNYSSTAFVFEGVKKTLTSPATIFQFWYRPASTATVGNGNSIFTAMLDNTFNTGTAPARLDVTPLTATTYKFNLIDPSSSFFTAAGSTSLTLGVPVRVVLEQTTAGWKVYLNNSTTPEITYVKAQATLGLQYLAFGTLFENAAGSYLGIGDFDEIWCRNPVTAPTTVAGKTADAYRGYLFNHLSAEGQPYRGVTDGANAVFGLAIDTVSESAAYLLKLAVQNNDQASFKLTDNWILQNLLRSNSTIANTSTNAAPTNALSLMAFHYNSANTDGKGIGTIYDANWAGDADPERAQALLWAHSRFGSSALTVGVAGELVTPNYLQRALNVINDLRTYAFSNSTATGFNYLLNDSFQQGNAVVQIGPDYMDPAAFKLFAQYDSANATFWANAVSGCYDILNKSADAIFSGNTPTQTTTSGLNPNWVSFTVATAVVGTSPSTYGDNDYGFNSFRTHYRLHDIYNWYGDTNALAPQRKAKAFWTNEYAVNVNIRATFKHDGTNTGTYSLTMFTYAAYWSLYSGDTANTTASAINSAKFANLYYQAPYGGIISDSFNSASYAYFGQSWAIIGYMQQAGTWINYGQAAGAVVTKTQLGIARLAITGVNTRIGVSRLSKTLAKTQPGLARLQTSLVATITGLSRLQKSVAKTQTGVARLQQTFTNTQIGVTRLQKALTNNQPAVARLTGNFTKTQAGISRLSKNLTKTQTGVAKLSQVFTRTQAGIGRLAVTGIKTQLGIARLTGTFTKTQTGRANIVQLGALTNSLSGVTRITKTLSKIQLGIGRLAVSGTRTQTGISRLTKILTKTQLGTARLQKLLAANQTGVARLTSLGSKIQVGLSRLAKTLTKTQTGVASLKLVFTKTQTGVARLGVTKAITITGRARLVPRPIAANAILELVPFIFPAPIAIQMVAQTQVLIILTKPAPILITIISPPAIVITVIAPRVQSITYK